MSNFLANSIEALVNLIIYASAGSGKIIEASTDINKTLPITSNE